MLKRMGVVEKLDQTMGPATVKAILIITLVLVFIIFCVTAATSSTLNDFIAGMLARAKSIGEKRKLVDPRRVKVLVDEMPDHDDPIEGHEYLVQKLGEHQWSMDDVLYTCLTYRKRYGKDRFRTFIQYLLT